MKKLLVIDNFDSFTYKRVQYFGQSGAACDVIRNSQLSLEEIDISPFDGIVLSPGPCDPDRAGISLSAVKAWEGKTLIDHEKMIERLKPIIFRSKYQYHHIFKKGDLLLMDQFTSLHRRTPVLDNNRLLWRLASDFKNVYEETHEPQSALAYNT